MRYTHFLLVAVPVLALTGAACAPAEEQQEPAAEAAATPEAEAAVRAVVIAHYEAINSGDLRTVIEQHTADFTGFLADKGPLQEYASHEEQLTTWGTEPEMTFTADWQVRDLKVRVLGDVALATFYLDGTVTLGEETMDGPWRVTEVWVREGEAWKELHHHDGPLVAGA